MPGDPTNLYWRNGIAWARFQVQGREVRRSLQTRDRAEAKRRLKLMRAELEHTRWHGHARHTYQDAVTRWTEEHLAAAVKPGTADRYLVSARQLHGTFDGLFLDQINRRKVADFVSRRRREGATNATIRRDLTALSRILACTVAWGWREDNPAKDFDRSVIREYREPIVPPSPDDVAKLIRGAPGNLARLIECLDRTGMRLAEATTLEWSQIDVARQEILLPKTKTNRPRIVPLSDPLVASAVGTIVGTPRRLRCPWVFWHSDGQPYLRAANQINMTTKRLMREDTPDKERISRHFRAHDLRHKFGIDYLRGGGSIYALQKILGHSSIQTTEGYVAYLDAESAQKAARVQRFSSGCADE